MNVVLKIMIGGSGGVGKTTLLQRYINGRFVADTAMTIGVQFYTKKIACRGVETKLALWDLGGQDRFKFLFPGYCNGARGALVLFSLHDIETLDDTGSWLKTFKEHAEPSSPVVLVGTKSDLVAGNELDGLNAMAVKFAESRGYSRYIPTSSKNGSNVKEAIEFLAGQVICAMRNDATVAEVA